MRLWRAPSPPPSSLYHRDQYSIEHLCALKHYSEYRSLPRAVLVCSLMVTSALIASLTFDVTPLQEPSAGWQRKYALWVHEFLGTLLLTVGVTLQLHAIASFAKLSRSQILFENGCFDWVHKHNPAARYALGLPHAI